MRASLLGLAALACVTGCGGTTVVEPGGGTETAGTGGAGPSSTASTGSVGATATGAGGAGGRAPAASCDDLCAPKTSPWCGVDPSCSESCAAAFAQAGACIDELEAAVACYAAFADATNCWLNEDCTKKTKAYAECIVQGQTCSDPPTCGGSGDTSCGCQLACGNAQFETACSYYDLSWDCHCKINGMSLGKCGGSGQDPCDPSGGCCKDYF